MESASATNPASPQANTTPVTFRNSRFLIAITIIGAIIGLCMAVGMLLIALTQVISWRSHAWDSSLSIVSWFFAAFCSAGIALFVWRIGLTMCHSEARLNSEGVDFRQDGANFEQKQFVEWNKIAAIRHTRSGNCQRYAVLSKDGSATEFTSYTFFRPRRLAKEIAHHCGQPIREGD